VGVREPTGAADSALREQAHVVAVISYHGRVVPGTLGLRAQHAAIQAAWLSPDIRAATRGRVATRYPAAACATRCRDAQQTPAVATARLPAPPHRGAVHAQLTVTIGWWLAMLTWLVATAPSRLPPAPPVSPPRHRRSLLSPAIKPIMLYPAV
jgi:hypothetical protein